MKRVVNLLMLTLVPIAAFAGQAPELREGDAVTTVDRTNGTVKQVFPDGVVKVNMTDGYYRGGVREYRTDQVSKPIMCFGNICANDAVTTVDRTNGTVKQVFPDGVVKVNMTDGYYRGGVREYSSNQVSKPISCLDKICANDSVTTVDRTNGTVKQVFPDGIVKVNMTDGYYRGGVREYSAKQLALYKKCSEAGGVDCRQ